MQNIKTMLTEIETEKKIKILYACETGSRAWGFPSPDSDYDVRFLYMHERDWYLSLNDQKDTIEHMDGELDITGWDIRKSLLLLKKSNVPLIERFQSPIVYAEATGFKAAFNELIQTYYSPIAVFYHHHSLAVNFWEDLKDKESIKLKSYCYLLRSLLSCNWIINDNAVPPMEIEGLMKYIDDDFKNELRKIIQLKATKNEDYLHPTDALMNSRIMHLFEAAAAAKDKLAVNNADMNPLNEFFLKMWYA